MCMTTTVSYTARCYAELHKNTEEMNWRNSQQPVWTRQMTEFEIAQVFGGNPDYIKEIGRNSDGQEWRLLDDKTSSD